MDISPNMLPRNAFNEVQNGRIVRSRIERFGGTQVFAEAPTVPELTNAQALFGIVREGSEGLLLVTSTSIYLNVTGTTWQNVSPLVAIANTNDWNLTQYGDYLILTSVQNEPLVLPPATNQFTIFADWPIGYTCQKIVPIKNILVALGVR